MHRNCEFRFLVCIPTPFPACLYISSRDWKVFSQVLYFGDHLLSDLRAPAKAGCRTAAVIRELEVLIALNFLH